MELGTTALGVPAGAITPVNVGTRKRFLVHRHTSRHWNGKRQTPISRGPAFDSGGCHDGSLQADERLSPPARIADVLQPYGCTCDAAAGGRARCLAACFGAFAWGSGSSVANTELGSNTGEGAVM